MCMLTMHFTCALAPRTVGMHAQTRLAITVENVENIVVRARDDIVGVRAVRWNRWMVGQWQ